MKRISLCMLLVLTSCGSGLNIAVWKGDHKRQIVKRQLNNGQWQWVETSHPYFSHMQCLSDSEMWKIKELYQRARRAGVKLDDL